MTMGTLCVGLRDMKELCGRASRTVLVPKSRIARHEKVMRQGISNGIGTEEYEKVNAIA